MGKDSFIEVLVEMHIPINTNMLDLFNQIFLAVSREFLMELAGNLGKSSLGRRAASSLSERRIPFKMVYVSVDFGV